MDAMTNTASALGLGPAAGLAPLKGKWGWIVALGVVYLVAGVVALGSVVMATIASVYVVGIMMIVAGVFEVIHSFQIKTWGRFLFWLALGILYVIAGFVAFDNPLLTAVWLTLILGAALVASGIMRVFLGFNMKGGTPWGWVVASGLITLLLGIIILIHWPVSSLYVLGIFLGVDLAVGVVFVAALIIFVFQNTQSVGVSFLALGVTLPLAVLVFIVYVLGALSGGSLYALLRRSVAGSRRA